MASVRHNSAGVYEPDVSDTANLVAARMSEPSSDRTTPALQTTIG